MLKRFITNHKGIFALFPLFVFLALYLSIGSYFAIKGSDQAFYKFPATSCVLIAFSVALLMGGKHVNTQIQYFLDGIRDENVTVMLLIFLLAGAFSALMTSMGGVDSVINMGLSFIPVRMLLPGLFLISCFISFAMGTSMGTIAAIVPIAIGFSESTELYLPLTMGVVLGGAMFGDNLSFISDTTIAATSTQKCKMKSKFQTNFKIILPAVIIILTILFFVSTPHIEIKAYEFSLIKVFPYLVVLLLTFFGTNVVVILMIGIFVSGTIGIVTQAFSFIEFGEIVQGGFMSMTEVIFLTFFISGLAAIAIERGGLEYILNKLKKYIYNTKTANFGIAALVSLSDICTANNTIAIILTGKMARKISKNFDITPQRSASILDIFASAWQGILPYSAQVLLISSLAKVSPFSVILFSWYSILLGISGIISILINRPTK